MTTATQTMTGVSAGALADVDRLLRDRTALLEQIRDGRDLIGLARAMIVTIVAGGAVFGAALGAYRGGIQIAYAAVKLPLVVLLTAALAAPALAAFNAALDRPTSLPRDLALVLAALATGSLALAALAPVVLLAVCFDAGYHDLTLLAVGCCGAGGIAALAVLIRGVRDRERRGALTAAAALCAVFALVGAQMLWTLRPWILRPRTPEVPFVRALEGSFVQSVSRSIDSARGVYFREAAPLPGEDAP